MIFYTSCTMNEVCFGKGRTSLWACFGTIGVLQLDFSGAEALTILFFPRLNPLSETMILLLFLAVPNLIFRFMLLGSM